MNARPGGTGQDRASAPAAVEPKSPPVISIAPPMRPRPASDVVLTPRIVDQAGYDELAGVLRDLIDHANDAVTRLDQSLAEARSRDQGVSKASMRFQDRLKVGADLLKALQAQARRAEAALETARTVDDARATQERAFDEKVSNALGRIEIARRVAEEEIREQRRTAMLDIEDERRRLEEVARNAADHAARLDEAVEQAEQTRAMFFEDLIAAADEIERLMQKVEGVRTDMTADAALCDQAAAELHRRIESFQEPLEQLKRLDDFVAEQKAAEEGAADPKKTEPYPFPGRQERA